MAALTRRHVLRAGSVGLALGVLGCTADDAPTDQRSPAPPPPPTADDLVRAAAVAAETSLLEAYAATSLAHPDLAGRLQTYADHHRAHLEALTPTGAPSGDPTASGIAGPGATGPTATGTSPPVSVPADPSAALASIGQAEAAAAAARTADCLAADDGELARLLASVAASEALHRDALGVP